MAVSSTTINWDALSSLTRDKFLPVLVDNIFNSNPLAVKLLKNAEKLDGGRKIITPLEYAMTQSSYYNPMIQSGTQGFLGDYISNVSKTASAAAGGFAGSAGVNTATSKLRDEYGKKVSDLIGQTTQMQQQQQKSVLDKIQTFKDTGRSLKYG